jgi:hypothetical protein
VGRSDCEANIISMSFGFPSNSEVISKAIDAVKDLRGGRVVFLASAGHSPMEEETFPAWPPSVISIRATDPHGQFLSMNASSSDGNHGPASLGTFGDCVPALPAFQAIRHKYPRVSQSGSSVATAVAAAISATLLAYANILPRLSPVYDAAAERLFYRLRESHGMEALFRSQAMRQTTADHRWFVNPLRFWRDYADHKERCYFLCNLLSQFDRKYPPTATHEQ